MYKCCIFDLDGTIINTIHSLSYTVSRTMEAFGYKTPPVLDGGHGTLGSAANGGQESRDIVDEEHTKLFVGDGYKKLVERALQYCGDRELVHYEEALPVYNEYFKKYCLYRIEAYDGIRELLDFLKEKGIRIGVVTNKGHDRALECVETVYGKGYFDSVLGEGNGFACKPDPAGALFMARQLGAEPGQCLYFGDTNTDMLIGIHAGMDTVGVTWGFRTRTELETYHPKFIISHPSEIKKVFE